jgi:hypothetical protein
MVAVPSQKHRQVEKESGTLVSHRNPGGKPRLYTFCGGPSWQLPFLALLTLLPSPWPHLSSNDLSLMPHDSYQTPPLQHCWLIENSAIYRLLPK